MSVKIPEEIWNQLVDIAKSDGVITQDEEVLLDTIKSNLERYYNSLEENPLTDEEKLEVFAAQVDIMSEAYDTAHIDGKISHDEYELLKKLQKIVTKFAEDEH
ncbi:MAG: hypothetical protein ACW98K_13290 [Candidatus Kariarchaeaceae archaeon]|jgi:tellurite resistance protein